MQFILALCVVEFAFVTLTSACCTPDQWEGEQGAVSGYYKGFGRKGLAKEFSRVAYDATIKSTAAFINVVSGEYENKYQMVTRFDDDCQCGHLYIVDLKTNKCYAKKLPGEFRKACIPKFAKAHGEFSLGLAGVFNVSSYTMERKHLSVDVTVSKLEDPTVCIPIGEVAYGEMGRYAFLKTVGFANITPGITNSSVFDIPAQCEKKHDFTLLDQLDHSDFIMAI